ncbi:HWE histidine kinase domain-containing protein [Acetobacter nitrogenifigens]|uniref:histidine kinase n=1 Tax=Acetobacter nitrogenifigens DSM 23921 = NBRC 105050 TaxID=1120919 RepID=A0A511XDR1_9PROT|nr:HWE histidine kinase domain-containing protein [Acetobacter nitrogenifigens]GEN61025.1 signal transduction histidine kinase [Acetobacter nitrogenifigens DSM 23921 = NBRC 105050]
MSAGRPRSSSAHLYAAERGDGGQGWFGSFDADMQVDDEATRAASATFPSYKTNPPIPRTVSPHSCLIAFDAAMRAATHFSANAPEMLGVAGDIPGRSIEQLLGAEAARAIRKALGATPRVRRPVLFFHMALPSGEAFDVSAFDGPDRVVIEFEPVLPGEDSGAYLVALRTMVDRMRDISSLPDLFDAVVRLLRDTLRFDRVVFFRYQPEGLSLVVAEARYPAMPSLLRRRFAENLLPSHDLSPYPGTRFRMLADTRAEPIPVLSGERARVDATDATSDGLAPAHLTRAGATLECLNARAAISNILIADDEPWGGFVCHHRTPRRLTQAQRVLVKMFGEYVSLQIVTLLRTNRLRYTRGTLAFIDRFLKEAARASDMPMHLRTRLGELKAFVPCDGAALWLGGEWTPCGAAPSVVGPFVELALERAGSQLWSTRKLVGTLSDVSLVAPGIAGVMVVPISSEPGNYLFLFRNEALQLIYKLREEIRQEHDGSGGGDPVAAENALEGVPAGSERDGDAKAENSFTLYGDFIIGHALPWSDEDVEVAGLLRSALIEVMGAYHQRMLAERASNDERLRTLNEELTHRVKNILAVVQSLVMQRAPEGRAVDEHLHHMRGRVRSLASAHDQIVRTSGGGMLRDMLESELEPYSDGRRSIVLDGPALWLEGEALSVTALTVHELATNAAKYGALSVSGGGVRIKWRLSADGKMWILSWREEGGPQVGEPVRRGFGSALIERGMAYELGGASRVAYDPAGLQVTLEIPVRYAGEARFGDDWVERVDAAQLTGSFGPPLKAGIGVHDERADLGDVTGDHISLDGLDVLVVEDQLLIALEVEQDLGELEGCKVRTASSVEEAIVCIDAAEPDVVLLDVNLGDETSEAVAFALRARGVPFILTTGYADRIESLKEFSDAPVIAKPYEVRTVISAIIDALGARKAA